MRACREERVSGNLPNTNIQKTQEDQALPTCQHEECFSILATSPFFGVLVCLPRGYCFWLWFTWSYCSLLLPRLKILLPCLVIHIVFGITAGSTCLLLRFSDFHISPEMSDSTALHLRLQTSLAILADSFVETKMPFCSILLSPISKTIPSPKL